MCSILSAADWHILHNLSFLQSCAVRSSFRILKRATVLNFTPHLREVGVPCLGLTSCYMVFVMAHSLSWYHYSSLLSNIMRPTSTWFSICSPNHSSPKPAALRYAFQAFVKLVTNFPSWTTFMHSRSIKQALSLPSPRKPSRAFRLLN